MKRPSSQSSPTREVKIPKPEVKESDAAGEEMEEEMEEEVPEETVEEEDPSPAAKKKPAANLPIAPSDKRDTSTKESGDGGKRGKIVSEELKKNGWKLVQIETPSKRRYWKWIRSDGKYWFSHVKAVENGYKG